MLVILNYSYNQEKFRTVISSKIIELNDHVFVVE